MRKFFFAFIFLILALLISCGETKLKPQIDHSISSDEIPDQESRDATITFTEDGKLKAVLYSDTIRVIESKNEKDLVGVNIKFYNDEENQTSQLTSKRGKIDDKTQDMYAIDSVVAVSDSGITLTTDELIWKNKTRKIVTDKFVKIVSDKEIIEGYGFESDQNLKNYTIFNITYVTTVDKND